MSFSSILRNALLRKKPRDAEGPDAPTGAPIGPAPFDDVGVPVDENGKSLIPELVGRDPTHNEKFLISGEALATASTNVQEFWWKWGANGEYDPKLFVRFLDDSLYVYHGVDLTTAVGFIDTDSPGRFVWRRLRDHYAYDLLSLGNRYKAGRKRPQVVRSLPAVLKSSGNR